MNRKQFSTRLNTLTTDRLEIMNNRYKFGKGRLIDRAVKILFRAMQYAESETSLNKDQITSMIAEIVDEIQEGEQ